jgi:hypothetical protein
MSRLDYQENRYVVVVADRPDMLHRADCYHLTVPNPGAAPSVTRPARLREARELSVCSHCASAEAREATP